MSRRLAGVLLIVPLLLVTTACSDDGATSAGSDASSSSETTEPSTTTSTELSDTDTDDPRIGPNGFRPDPIDWESCGRDLECGELDVPVDYDDVDGPTLRLALVRVPAADPGNRIGAILTNPGGPGASGIAQVEAGGPNLGGDVRERFDIVGFDPRGVGQSTPLDCADADVLSDLRSADPSPDTPTEERALEQVAQAIADDCERAAGDLLAHVGTDDVARDVDAIRAAMGEAQISFTGFSYGTFIALRYLELFPGHARAIVLDGVVDPAADLPDVLRGQTVAADRVLQEVFDACPDGQRGCPEGGAEAAYDRLAREVEEDPLPTSGERDVGPAELAIAGFYTSYLVALVPTFYQALSDGLEGDGDLLLAMAEAYESAGEYASYAAVWCLDSEHPVGTEAWADFATELAEISPRFGAAIANELLPCAVWPTDIQDVTEPVDGSGGPPVLVVGNTDDVATPYEQAETVAEMLDQARLVTYESAGHTAIGFSTCVRKIAARYLIDVELPDDGIVCRD